MDIQLSLAQRLKVLFSGKLTANIPENKQHTNENEQKETKQAPRFTQDNSAAVNLISLLQKHGRLIDFIFEEIDGYSDEEVGAGARVVHEGCKKVLKEHVKVSPINCANEETTVIVEKGFDSAKIKLSGNIEGEAPYSGILIHKGWEVTEINLPQVINAKNAMVICPAEVELT